MSSRLVLPFAALALAACSSAEDVAEATGVEQGGATAKATSTAKGAAKAVSEETETYTYELSYPAAVGAIPALAKHIDDQAAKAKTEMIAMAEEGKADAATNDYPFNPHSLSEEWQVVADIPGYLSLSNSFSTYTGGAHGMYGLDGLVWDKAGQRALVPLELFASPAALTGAIGERLCASLNKERVQKGSPPIEEEGGTFEACPGVDQSTVLVGSSNGKTFDRITLWYGPYVAGSYAEGAYELDFPMTAAMVDAVKPAYRAAFSEKK